MLTKKAGIPLLVIVLLGIAALASIGIIGYGAMKDKAADSKFFGFIEPKGWVLYDDATTDRISELWGSSNTLFQYKDNYYTAIGPGYGEGIWDGQYSIDRPIDNKKVLGVKTDAYFNPGSLDDFYVCVGDKNDVFLVDEGYCVRFNVAGTYDNQVTYVDLRHYEGGEAERIGQKQWGFNTKEWFTTSIIIEDGKYVVKVDDAILFEDVSDYAPTSGLTVYEVDLRKRGGQELRVRNVYDYLG